MNILVTGATGFVGQALCMVLQQRHMVYGTTRRAEAALPVGVHKVVWAGDAAGLEKLPPIDVVVHLAARVHVMQDNASDPLEAFRAANVEATLALARWASSHGVQRFVFLSSLKVNGEATSRDAAFSEADKPMPEDAYAVSKLEAEQGLQQVCTASRMEFVVIRPPLVYGPSVRGNFQSIIRCVRSEVPLPLGLVSNRRSFLALDNLVDFILTCITHPAAANEIFLVSDGEPISTTELLRKISRAYAVSSRLVPVPASCLEWAARLFGKSNVAKRLLGSLVINDTKARSRLAWQPATSMDEQLRKMALDDTRA